MAKVVLLLFCFVGVYLKLSASTSFECNFNTYNWNIVKNSYCCYASNSRRITTRESASINSISGTHLSGLNNSDVDGFYVEYKTINYFPRGLDHFFKNLKAIEIYKSKLREIHQEDLKPFPRLVELILHYNLLEVLEEGLFDFNTDLEYIYFEGNKIVNIKPHVFDHLSRLSYLYLTFNVCIDRYAENSISNVRNVIIDARLQCVNSEYSTLKVQLASFETESKFLNSQEFSKKFSALETIFNASNFANFFTFKLHELKDRRQHALTIITNQVPTTTTESVMFETCSELETKVESIAASLNDLMIQTSNGTYSNSNLSDALDTKLVGIVAAIIQRTEKIEDQIMVQNLHFEEKLTKIMEALKINN
jgi:hypothetical protein